MAKRGILHKIYPKWLKNILRVVILMRFKISEIKRIKRIRSINKVKSKIKEFRMIWT